MFKDRPDAARQLAHRLAHLKGQRPLVLAIPRDAVPMGRVIADALGGELDVVLVRKLGAPGKPEYAMGAVSEDGTVQLGDGAGLLYAGDDYVHREVQAQREVLRARRERYTPIRPPIDPAGRLVVVVDDGSAAGAAMLAALQSVRERGPRRLVAALAVAPPDALRRIEAAADEVVCLLSPAHFHAAGQFFEDFRRVSDEEVVDLLRASAPAARWEHLEHGADIGVRGYGPTPAAAFEQAALALTALLTDPALVAPREAVRIEREAPDLDFLLLDWINALVYEMATRRLLFGRFEVGIADHRLRATAYGEPVDVGRHRPAVEVKGATLTALRVAETAPGRWLAQCIVDV